MLGKPANLEIYWNMADHIVKPAAFEPKMDCGSAHDLKWISRYDGQQQMSRAGLRSTLEDLTVMIQGHRILLCSLCVQPAPGGQPA